MEEFQGEFPDISMILEMDREHAPYGNRTDEEIKNLTRDGVSRLFTR